MSRGKQLVLLPDSPDVSRDEVSGNIRIRGKTKLVSRGTIYWVLGYIFRLSLKQSYGKNMLLYSVRGQQLHNCIPVGIHLNLIRD